MDVLTDKTYRSYSYFSRYSNFPYYYNIEDDKYIYGTTAQLSDKTPYQEYTTKRGDTFDSLAFTLYNNPLLYWVICDFNRIQDPYTELQVGTRLKIPTISSITYTTGK